MPLLLFYFYHYANIIIVLAAVSLLLSLLLLHSNIIAFDAAVVIFFRGTRRVARGENMICVRFVVLIILITSIMVPDLVFVPRLCT